MLAGLEDVDRGRIRIGGRDVTHTAPKDRDIAMVFQNYALYPHMTVADNMGFALKIAGVAKTEIRKRVEDAAEILDLTPYLDRKPKALSGGQRQRVAMGRAIVRQPQVFLMDEPLSNLDAKLRVQTRTQIAQLQRRLGDHHRLRHPRPGRGHDHGRPRRGAARAGCCNSAPRPRELYRNPANVFVAGFIGSPAMNLFTVPVGDGGVTFGEQLVPVPRDELAAADREAVFGIRPEHLQIVDTGGIDVRVDVVEELGSEAFVFGHSHIHGQDEQIVVRVDWRNPPAKGDTIHVSADQQEAHVFSAASGERLAR